MHEARVRGANRRDLPSLVSLWQEMMDFHRSYDARFRFSPNAPREVERHLLETLRSRAARILVAEAEQRIIGYIVGEAHARRPIYPVGTYGFISDICVSSAWRRRGVGSALVRALESWFAVQKVTSIELFAAALNPHSIAFWRAMGYDDYLRLMRRDFDAIESVESVEQRTS
jgi:ribosomal protein S18 acetylase RimI-like enzyme